VGTQDAVHGGHAPLHTVAGHVIDVQIFFTIRIVVKNNLHHALERADIFFQCLALVVGHIGLEDGTKGGNDRHI
jgi:hypothetical protein